MSKKVLILSASPRLGGNSDLLCDQFMSGAKEAGHTTEKIFLNDKNINYCTGCGTCFIKQNACPQKDDMTEVLDKMVKADVLVMATPVYFYSMSAQLKTLIDRTCARYTEMGDKEFYLIMTAADKERSCMDKTIEGFRGYTSCFVNSQERGFIYGTGLFQMGDVKDNPIMQEAYDMGKGL